MSNKRYFHIVYSWWGNSQSGKGTCSSSGTGFFNKTLVTEVAQQSLFEQYKIRNAQIVIENWIEMTEKDFNDFYENNKQEKST